MLVSIWTLFSIIFCSLGPLPYYLGSRQAALYIFVGLS
ncbi:hypothetical protein CPT_Madawaska_207 [Staphylococcus phage Madawaska]|nr:hypothetical protein CPT_Madawaska_207 [Staphylococcus phage Madawaska]